MAVPGLDPGIDPAIHENTDISNLSSYREKFIRIGESMAESDCVDGRQKAGHDSGGRSINSNR
jgi:hypothetical protein